MTKKAEEPTPVHDELKTEAQTVAPDPTKASPPVEVSPDPAPDLAYLQDADSADLTSFEEDDDPLKNVGDLVDEGPVAAPEEKN